MRTLSVLVVVFAVAVAFVLVGCSESTTPPALDKMSVDQLKAEVARLDAKVADAQKAADKAVEDQKTVGTDKTKVEAAQKLVDKTATALKAATAEQAAAAAELAKRTATAPVKP